MVLSTSLELNRRADMSRTPFFQEWHMNVQLTIRFRWINDGKRVWTFKAGGIGANPLTEISERPVPREPMVRVVHTFWSMVLITPGITVYSYQFGLVIWVQSYQPRSRFPRGDACGLYPSISTERCNQLWLRSCRIPHLQLHQPIH
jgi:hypothetical protein